MRFREKPHSSRPGVYLAEVCDDKGNLIATVVPGDTEQELRVISKYLSGVLIDQGFIRVELESTDGPVSAMEALFGSGEVKVQTVSEMMVAYNENMRRRVGDALDRLSDPNNYTNERKSCCICSFTIMNVECQEGCPANTLRKFYGSTCIGDLVEVPGKGNQS